MKQNIYDDEGFFRLYNEMRTDDAGRNANDLIEIPAIRKMLPVLSGKKVLDLGCGAGGGLQYFLSQGAAYVLGTDISEKMIDLARNEIHDERCDLRVLAIEDISKIDMQFDVVVSSLALHYVADFAKVLKDVYDLLTVGGEFVFSIENPIGTGTILNEKRDGKDGIMMGNKRYFLLSDYNRSGKRVVRWNDCDVIKYHRSFSEVVNAIVASGLEIKEMVEPTPDEEVLRANPKYADQFDKPYFLFVRLVKSH